jgi:hypothetical protein
MKRKEGRRKGKNEEGREWPVVRWRSDMMEAWDTISPCARLASLLEAATTLTEMGSSILS